MKDSKKSLKYFFKKLNKNKIKKLSKSINELNNNKSRSKNLSINNIKQIKLNNTIKSIKSKKNKNYYFPESFSINIKQTPNSINLQKDLFIKKKKKSFNQNISTKFNFNIKPKLKVNIINTSLQKKKIIDKSSTKNSLQYLTEFVKLNKVKNVRNKKKLINKSEINLEEFLKPQKIKKNKTNEKYFMNKKVDKESWNNKKVINWKKIKNSSNKSNLEDKYNKYKKTNIDLYLFSKLIGKGNFGDVYLAQHKLTNLKVAIKIISKKEVIMNNMYDKVTLEIDTLFKSFGHENIVKLYEIFENEKYIYMIMEYCEDGDLIKFLKKNGLPSEKFTKKIIYQILKGLEYLHQNKILHRDIKLDNILINKDKICKICDFGIATFIKENQKIYETPGTPAYLAPEVIRKEGKVSYGTDIWSIGILLFALIFGDFPFNGKNPQDIYKLIYLGNFKFPKSPKISSVLKNLFYRIFTYDIKKRITLKEWLNNEYFSKIKYTPIINLNLNLKVQYQIKNYFESLGISYEKVLNDVKNNKKNYWTTAFYLKYKNYYIN